MKNYIKIIVVSFVVLVIGLGIPTSAEAKIKVKKITQTYDMNEDDGVVCYSPVSLNTYTKVTVKNSNKKVVSAKYVNSKIDGKFIKIKAKSGGKAVLTINLYKRGELKKIYKLAYKVIGKGQDGYKAVSKKAFQIQNEYRRENGADALEWSDELYDFALYRIKKHGYDCHKNTRKDTSDYFGDFAYANSLSLGENMAIGTHSSKVVMTMWKNSPGHYQNICNKDYKSGAIAKYKNIWCAVFSSEEASVFENYQNVNSNTRAVTVRRYDSITNKYLDTCFFQYYEEGDKWNTIKAKSFAGDINGTKVYLEIGKTYVFTERKAMDGYGKAEEITVKIEDDGVTEIVLKS